VSFDFGSWQGLQVVSGGLNHGRDGELRQGTGEFSDFALLYGWHHGSFCVTYDGAVQPPPDPEPTGPTASFTVDCDGLTCTFTDTSTEGDAEIATWSWDFGDGNGGSGETVEHTYDVYGTYTVELTVTDLDGLEDTERQDVTVTDPDDPVTMTLTVTMSKVRGATTAHLDWSPGLEGVNLYNVYKDGVLLKTASTPSTTDDLGRGGGTVTYQVCAADDDDTCSAPVTVNY